LSVKTRVISKGKKDKHSSMNFFAFSDVIASYTLKNKVLVTQQTGSFFARQI